MQYDLSRPIYEQVAMDLLKDILNGKLLPGEKLPSGRELALRYEINPNTAARVYQEMERRELCFRKRGMGTYVTEEEEKIRKEKRQLAKSYTKEYLKRMEELAIPFQELAKYLQEENHDSM